jgi:hypothetical protein
MDAAKTLVEINPKTCTPFVQQRLRKDDDMGCHGGEVHIAHDLLGIADGGARNYAVTAARQMMQHVYASTVIVLDKNGVAPHVRKNPATAPILVATFLPSPAGGHSSGTQPRTQQCELGDGAKGCPFHSVQVKMRGLQAGGPVVEPGNGPCSAFGRAPPLVWPAILQ